MVYWSFLELGVHLADEDAWVPMMAQPTVAVKEVSAGMSQVFAALIKEFFGARTFDLRTGGIQLEGPDGSQARLFADLSMVLQDGAAQTHVLGMQSRCWL